LPGRLEPTMTVGEVCLSRARRLRGCETADSNSHGLPHWILSPARLPIPPLTPRRACTEATIDDTVRFVGRARGCARPRRARGAEETPPRARTLYGIVLLAGAE